MVHMVRYDFGTEGGKKKSLFLVNKQCFTEQISLFK